MYSIDFELRIVLIKSISRVDSFIITDLWQYKLMIKLLQQLKIKSSPTWN